MTQDQQALAPAMMLVDQGWATYAEIESMNLDDLDDLTTWASAIADAKEAP